MSSGTSQQFCVRWNSHLGSLGAAFPQLLAGQRFVDVTLACEGHQLHCHRLVLAACSTYFESLLGENPCKHPIIILPRDIKLWEIQALVDFMYKGEVNVSQAGLSDLLKCAEILQIRGLCGSDAALNLNQVNTGNVQYGSTPASVNFVNSVPANAAAASTTPTTTTSQSNAGPSNSSNTLGSSLLEQSTSFDQGESLAPTNSNSSKKCTDTVPSSSPAHTNKIATDSSENSLLLKTIKHERLSASDSHLKEFRPRTSTPNRVIDKVEPVDISMEEDVDDDDLNHANEKSLDGETYSTKYVDYLEGAKGEFPLANVICEYDSGGLQTSTDNIQGRRVRRSETLLRQAAEFVSRGQTFQTVSDTFGIPISTIRFFMARKGILPRRKRGRSAGVNLPLSTAQLVNPLNDSSNSTTSNRTNENNITHSRSASPSEPPFHFATYKLPELKPKLL